MQANNPKSKSSIPSETSPSDGPLHDAITEADGDSTSSRDVDRAATSRGDESEHEPDPE